MADITAADARTLTLAYLRDLMSKLPAAWRTAPQIQFDFKSYSIPDMIAQVEMNTAVGIRYVSYHTKAAGNIIVG